LTFGVLVTVRDNSGPGVSGGRCKLRVEFGFAAGLKNDVKVPLLALLQCGAGNLDRLAVCRGVRDLELATAADLKPVMEVGVRG